MSRMRKSDKRFWIKLASKGGKASAASLTHIERSLRAKKAARARWSKYRQKIRLRS